MGWGGERGRCRPTGLLGMVAIVVAIESSVAARWMVFTESSGLAWPLSVAATRGEAREARILCFGDSLVKHGILPAVLEGRLGEPAYNLALPASTAPAHYFLFRRALRAGASPRAVVVDYMPAMLTGTPPFGLPYWPGLIGPRDFADLARSWVHADFVAEAAVRCLLPSFQSRWAIRESLAFALRGQTARTVENNLMLRRNWRVHRGAQFTQDNPWWNGIPSQVEHDRHLSTRFWCHPVNRESIHRLFDHAASRGIRDYWVLPPAAPERQRRRTESGADAKYTQFVREMTASRPNVVTLDARALRLRPHPVRRCHPPHRQGGALTLSRRRGREAIASGGSGWVTAPHLPRADARPPPMRRSSNPAPPCSRAARSTGANGTKTRRGLAFTRRANHC